MSSISSALSFKNIFNEKILISNLSQEIKVSHFDNEDLEILIEKLDSYLNNTKLNKNSNIKNSFNFSSLLKILNNKLDKTSAEIFDKIAFKLYNKLTDTSKELMNQLKTNNDLSKNELFKFNFINLNLCLSSFFNTFHRKFQNYNEVHKNIIKNTPNYLKVFFKLLEENLECILSLVKHNYKETDFMKSFLSFISILIQTQTNMLRPFEIRLENIINTILISVINCNDIKKFNKGFLSLSTALYGYSINLNNDINKKFPVLLDKYFNSLNIYLDLILPVGIKNKKNINMGSESKENHIVNNQMASSSKISNNNNKENNFNFFFDEISENIRKNPIKCRNTIYLIFQLIKNLLKKIIIIFNSYMNCYVPIFKDLIKKFTIYKLQSNSSPQNNYDNFLEMKIEILKFTQILIKNFDLKIFSFSKEYINKLAIEEFCDILICFLEKNDKTIVKIDKGYFKLGAISNVNMKSKNNPNNKKGNMNISLLDLAKQETYNAKLDIYTNDELSELIICYINSKKIFKLKNSFY